MISDIYETRLEFAQFTCCYVGRIICPPSKVQRDCVNEVLVEYCQGRWQVQAGSEHVAKQKKFTKITGREVQVKLCDQNEIYGSQDRVYCENRNYQDC